MSLTQKIETPSITYEQPIGLYIDGKWVKGKEGKTFETINPTNEKLSYPFTRLVQMVSIGFLVEWRPWRPANSAFRCRSSSRCCPKGPQRCLG